jgi:hypothetical protein
VFPTGDNLASLSWAAANHKKDGAGLFRQQPAIGFVENT